MQLHRPERHARLDKHVSDNRHFGLDSLSMLNYIFLQLKLCEISLIVFVKVINVRNHYLPVKGHHFYDEFLFNKNWNQFTEKIL